MKRKYEYQIDGCGVTVAFDGKPDDDVRRLLKSHGFRWNPHFKQWWRRRVTGAADVLTGLDYLLYPEDRPENRRAKCWRCGDPDGRMRSRGAATPVYCDPCAEQCP